VSARPGTMTFLGLVLAALTMSIVMRSTLVAVAPISDVLGADLGLDAGGIGLLMTIPVLSFGLLSGAASLVIARIGPNLAMTVMLFGVALGVIVRSAGGAGAAFAGTALLGAAITVGNVLLPVLVRRDAPPERAGIVTGVFVAGANLASLVATVATVPLVDAVGWRIALGLWAVVALGSLAVWIGIIGPGPAFRRRSSPTAAADEPTPAPSAERTWGSLTAICLLVGFGAQAFAYYGVTTWLPAILADRLGVGPGEAGGVAGLFQIFGVVGALGIPLIASRLNAAAAVGAIWACWLAVPLGLLLMPEGWAVWMALGGIGQGGGITIVLTLVAQVGRSQRHVRRLSALVQGGGYVIAATGSFVLGAAFQASGGWTLPLWIVLMVVNAFGVLVGLTALRARRAGAAAAPG